MSDDTRDFRIKITTEADTSGVREQDSALNGLAENDVQQTKRMIGGKHELRAAMSLLGHEFGILGGMVHFLFNPWTAAIGGILVATRALHAANKLLDDSMEALSGHIGKIRDALRDVQIEAIKTDKAFNQNLENNARGTQLKIAGIHTEREAAEKLAEARKQYELSQAQTPEAKMAIEQRYAASGAASSAQFDRREIAAKQFELDNLGLALHESKAATQASGGGLSREEVEARLKDLPKKLSDFDSQITALKKVSEDIKPGWGTHILDQIFPGAFNARVSTWTETLPTISGLEAARKQTAASLEPLTRTAAGYTEQDALGKRIGDLTPELDQQIKTATSQTQNQKLVDLYKAGAEAHSETTKLTEEIKRAIESGKGISVATLQSLRSFTAWQADIERQIRSIKKPRVE
jgi:hypothetical protein